MISKLLVRCRPLRHLVVASAIVVVAVGSYGQEPNPLDPFEARRVALRVGKMPKGLPAWFELLDLNKDGQIGLNEWRKARKRLGDFGAIDTNDDGFITRVEAVRYSPPPFAEVGERIDAIIYSKWTTAEMLARLAPYVAIKDTKATVQKRTGLVLQESRSRSGPGFVKEASVPHSGLYVLIVKGEIRLIRRHAATLGRTYYPALTIGADFEGTGYVRVYVD